LDLRGRKWRKTGEDLIMRSFVTFASPNIIKVIKSRWMIGTGYVARMEEMRNAYNTSVGKPEGKRPLGRPRRRWEDNIRIYEK
jgi:hypothetical protein